MTSLIVLVDSIKCKMPKWWAFVILFAPITTPYYLISSKKEKGILPLLFFVVIFSFACTGEYFIYSKAKKASALSQYSTVGRKMMDYSSKVEYGISKLNISVAKLDRMVRVDATIERLDKTINFLLLMKNLINTNNKILKRLILMGEDYKKELKEENLDWLFGIRIYYTEKEILKYFKSLYNYIEIYSYLLTYTKDNFKEIKTRNPRALKNFDEYIFNYLSALERHNLMNTSRKAFQIKFLKQYPRLINHVPTINDQVRAITSWLE